MVIDWLKVLRPTRHKIGYFGDVLSSQPIALVTKNENKYRQWRGLTVIHTCRSYIHSPRADSSDFGLMGSKVPQNGRFPAQDAPEPLALPRSSARGQLRPLASFSNDYELRVQTVGNSVLWLTQHPVAVEVRYAIQFYAKLCSAVCC